MSEIFGDKVSDTHSFLKSDGKYVIYPDLGLIYASLMRKYSAVSEAF